MSQALGAAATVVVLVGLAEVWMLRSVVFAPTTNPIVLAVTGQAVYTAANGDELHATLRGELDTLTGAIAVTVTYVGGTGRFATASGSAALAGQMLGGGAVSIPVAGGIRF